MVALNFDPTQFPPRASYDNLPAFSAIEELKSRRQWVAWKYVEKKTSEGKTNFTKVPVCPHSNFNASVSNPRTWNSYDAAVKKAQHGSLAGVGYVLTEDDDISGADLDACVDLETGQFQPWAQEIVDLAETYMELSPSGAGFRIFWRGKVESTFKHDPAQVEVYRSARYLTITGEHLDGTPTEIKAAPKTEALLRARVAQFKPKPDHPTQPATIVTTVLPSSGRGSEFFRRVNTEALATLTAWVPSIFPSAKYQPGTRAFRISSRQLGRDLQEDLSLAPNGIVDFGIHDMGDGRDGKRTPIDIVLTYGQALDARSAAFWLCDRLGRDPISLGWEEDDGHGAELAAQLLAPEIPLDGTVCDPETGEVLEPAKPVPQSELPAHLARVPGLVGEIAEWITDTALYPQPALSLGAALALVGTAAGRHLSGPNRCGTHLYIVGLAPSGAGKNHPLTQIATILSAAEMRAHIGPSQFISMPAVINFLVRSPLSLCAMDEFGAFLKRINNRRASGFEGAISGLLRTAWGASFSAMSTPEWAQRASETIFSPAMSIYGVSTAREFYDSLEGGDVTNGVLNRFLLIETKIRPKERQPLRDASQVPQSITNGLKAIYNRSTIAAAQLCQSRQAPPFYTVAITSDAEQIRRGLVEEINSRSDADPTLEPFLARTAENALRLATIVSVGQNPGRPQITAPAMLWAREFSVWSSNRLADGAGLYIADSDTQAAANAVRRAIQEKGGRIKRRDLIRALQHKYKSRELDDVIRALAESEHIKIEKSVPTNGGTPSFWYSIFP